MLLLLAVATLSAPLSRHLAHAFDGRVRMLSTPQGPVASDHLCPLSICRAPAAQDIGNAMGITRPLSPSSVDNFVGDLP